MAIAMVASLVFKPHVRAANDNTAVASYKTWKEVPVKGSEKVKPIEVKSFLENIWHSTGIYKIIHTETPEEAAKAKLEAEIVEAEKNGCFGFGDFRWLRSMGLC